MAHCVPTGRSAVLLAGQNVARADFGADIDDARFVEVAKRFLADVRNVARDVFGAEARVARGDFEFLDVDRGEDVVLHDRSDAHTSELQSLLRTSYAVFCLKKKTTLPLHTTL